MTHQDHQNYNYYVYTVGQIKNIPLTGTYSIFTYTGGNYTHKEEVVKATTQSVEMATSLARSKSVVTTHSGTITGELNAGVNFESVFGVNVKRGYTACVTQQKSETSLWEESYKNCVQTSESKKSEITFTFNSECEKGNYLYLCLGTISVYCAVIQSRENPEEYYVETYDKIDAHKYALIYTGEEESFPINEKEKIEVKMDFVSSLKAPTQYLEGVSLEDTYEPFEKKLYWDESVKVGLNGHAWWATFDNMSYYEAKGYDKIEISYEFYVTGTKSLISGNVDFKGYISPTDKTADNVDHFSAKSSTDGKWIRGTVSTDLKWFVKSGKVYLLITHANLTEKITVSKLTLNIKIYKG